MIPQNTVLKALNKNIGNARSSVESAMQANILQKSFILPADTFHSNMKKSSNQSHRQFHRYMRTASETDEYIYPRK